MNVEFTYIYRVDGVVYKSICVYEKGTPVSEMVKNTRMQLGVFFGFNDEDIEEIGFAIRKRS